MHWFAENRDMEHPKLSTLPTAMQVQQDKTHPSTSVNQPILRYNVYLLSPTPLQPWDLPATISTSLRPRVLYDREPAPTAAKIFPTQPTSFPSRHDPEW